VRHSDRWSACACWRAARPKKISAWRECGQIRKDDFIHQVAKVVSRTRSEHPSNAFHQRLRVGLNRLTHLAFAFFFNS